MTTWLSRKNTVGRLTALILSVTMIAFFASCGGAPTPIPVVGPNLSGNDPPALSFLEPTVDTTRGQGDPLLIRWTDSDRDDNATISFSLLSTTSSTRILLIEGLDENDTTGPDSVTVNTQLVPEGVYHLQGIIDDDVNAAVEVFATTTDGGATNRRLEFRLVGEGQGGISQPPVLAVTLPQFSQSVSQDDLLTVIVQPSLLVPNANLPFDQDSDITLFLVLDLDQNPNNDDPASPEPGAIILLSTRTVALGAFEPVVFTIPIDLNVVQPRADGAPYFIRVSADDGTNPRVHNYAVGTINVVQLAAGMVDLFDVGRTKSGARFYGFNPSANVGSTITSVSDFDADGAEDFVIVAKKGNARNVGPVGEAYLIYGQQQLGVDGLPTGGPGTRFGGAIPVNSVSLTVSGVVFEAPPVRSNRIRASAPRTDGITDASFITDITGDGRPELLFGMRHVHGAFEAMDFDPGDEDLGSSSEELAIETVFRQGRVTVKVGDADAEIVSQSYSGVEETYISSATPGTSNGSSTGMSWRDAGANQREWTLIKFKDVLEELPDELLTIEPGSIDAELELRIFNTGGNGVVRQAFTDFNEQTTYNNFAGGDPQVVVNYSDEDLGTANGGTAERITIDVSELVQRLIDFELGASNDEIRLIIFPGPDDPTDQTGARTSEFNVESDRPTLTITYNRLNIGGGLDCYPDDLVNNRTDTDQADQFDVQFTAVGMGVMVASENRDNNPLITPPVGRLDTTAIALELVGVESGPGWVLDGDGTNNLGNIFARAEAEGEAGRIAGARFMNGPFDFEDGRILNQPPRDDWFGDAVASIGDLNNDGLDELVFSSPRNELHLEELDSSYGLLGTHLASTQLRGSIAVLPGRDYSAEGSRELSEAANGNNVIPYLDHEDHDPFGQCSNPPEPRHMDTPADTFQVFAEDVNDMLGQAGSAGDFNQDGLDDILCGGFQNDRGNLRDTGAVYILYGRSILGDFRLENADNPILRPPMLRVRGRLTGDQIGWRQTSGLDVNGDRIDDVFIGAPRADFGAIERNSCAGDFDRDGTVDNDDLSITSFNSCRNTFGEEVFSNDTCKVFDYNNDNLINDDDRCVFCCLSGSCSPDANCVHGLDDEACCKEMVDNGFVGIIFGGVFTDGDRDIRQIGTADLRGTRFFGAAARHRAGWDVSSAGDFNQDGFGDLLIAVPGETRLDDAGRERLGVVYLVFGGTHLENTEWNLSQVGSEDLPGIVFLSPYVKGRPNEAPPETVALVGDINNDGFDDIAIGNPTADFIDLSFPQGPEAPGGDAAVGRRRNAGDAYIVYGNNFGTNRGP